MENKKWSLYIHTNKINHKQYVGITSRKVKDRWGKNGNNYICDNTYFGNAIKKYGWDNFEHEIIFDTCLTNIEAKELEQYYINTLNTKRPNGYNLTDGGDGMNGWKPTEETRKNFSDAQKKRSAEGRNQTMLGRHHSEESKKKMSESHKMISLSDETRKKMSDSAKKLWANEEYKEKRLKEMKESKSKASYIYRPMSEEQKQKLSNARKEKCSGKNNHNARKVWCVELKMAFDTIKEAGEYFGAKQSTYKKIGLCCSGLRATCMGYHWMYYEDYLKTIQKTNHND